MGTKNNPSKHDCYAKADPNEPMFVLLGRDPLAPEPMFVLLGRDPLAPILVNLWAQLRVNESGYVGEKTKEAVDTALAMQLYRQGLKR